VLGWNLLEQIGDGDFTFDIAGLGTASENERHQQFHGDEGGREHKVPYVKFGLDDNDLSNEDQPEHNHE